MKDAQENSFQSQQKYFTAYIQRHPDWDFVAVYTDEGISAVNTKRREGFSRMVKDALAEYLFDRDGAIEQLRYAKRMLTDTDFIDADIRALEEELTAITEMLRLCIAQNAANTMTEETYRTTHAELCSRFEETQAKMTALQKQRDKMNADAITIGGMMFELGELEELPIAFDEKLWSGTIDRVTVYADERVVFRFKDGKEVTTIL